MVRSILAFFFSIPLIFNMTVRPYDIDTTVMESKYLARGLYVCIPTANVGHLDNKLVDTRYILFVPVTRDVYYSDIDIYSPQHLDISQCKYGYFIINKEIDAGTYTFYNATNLQQTINIYSKPYYIDKYLLESHIVEPKQEIQLTLEKGILYNGGCTIK